MISIIKSFNSYTPKICFKRNQESHIEKQVKQVMFENFEDIHIQTVKRSKDEIEKLYFPRFKQELQQEKGVVSKQDLNTIISTLSDIYKKSGLDKDVEILNNYSKI